MIVKEEFLSQLRRIFRLNLYEVRVWTALLSRGVSTAGELSDIGNVPRSRTYDILESLEKKGFVVLKLGKPIKFIALKPEEVIERVKKNVVVEARASEKRLDKLKRSGMLQELNSLYTQGVKYIEPTDLSGALRGRHNLYSYLDMLVRQAENRVTIVTSEDGLGRKIEALKPSIEKVKKKGVSVRIAAPITKKNVEIAKDLGKIAEVRHIVNPKSRFCVVDGRELMFMVMDDAEVHPNYDVGVWSKTDFFANALEKMFDTTWNNLQSVDSVKLK